jgi:hypothetical protein
MAGDDCAVGELLTPPNHTQKTVNMANPTLGVF